MGCRKEILDYAMAYQGPLVVASRNYGLEELRKERTIDLEIENMGFGRKQIDQYVSTIYRADA